MVDMVPATGAASVMRPTVELCDGRPVDFWSGCMCLMNHKWLIVTISLLCGAAGASYAFLATPWYRAEVELMATEQKSPLGGLGQIGGLASLAGIDIGSQGDEESMAVLRSRSFTAEFINSKNLIPVLFANEWDGGRKSWKVANPDKHPDIRKAVEYFDENVRTVGEDKKTGVVTISVAWVDGHVAADWANEIVTLINARLRKRALEEAERNVRYLQQEISATNVVSLQQSIGRILESEMKKVMMARGSEEYAFKIVDRAVPPRRHFRPQRVLFIVMSVLTGMLFSVGFVLLRRTVVLNTRQRPSPQ